MTATNWASPLVLPPEEAQEWKQFEVERPCKFCTPEPKDYMLALLPLTVWVKHSSCKCGCGKQELVLHPISVEELRRFQEYRRSSVTVASYVVVCESMGHFVD